MSFLFIRQTYAEFFDAYGYDYNAENHQKQELCIQNGRSDALKYDSLEDNYHVFCRDDIGYYLYDERHILYRKNEIREHK